MALWSKKLWIYGPMVKKTLDLWAYGQKNSGSMGLWSKKLWPYGPMVKKNKEQMEVIKTDIEGVVIIEPRIFNDARGYFFESYSKREFDEKVRPVDFVQDNESCSTKGRDKPLPPKVLRWTAGSKRQSFE